MVQLSILALQDVDLTVTMELLNGQFYQDFDSFIPGNTDFSIFTPSRAMYKPSSVPSRNAFMAILDQNVLSSNDIALPFNLPMQQYRNPGVPYKDIGLSGSTYFAFEKKILLSRISNLKQ